MSRVLADDKASLAAAGSPGTAIGVLTTASAFALFALLGVLFAGMGAALPELRVVYHLGPTSGTELVSVFNAGALLSTAAFGIGVRKLRPRPALTTLLVMIGSASVVMSLATSWGMLLAATLVTGCGFGGLVLLLNTAFARGFGVRSVLRLNLLNAMFGVGAIGGPLVIGLAPHEDLPYVFLVAGVLILACWPVRGCAVLLREQAADGQQGSGTVRNLPILLSFAAIGLLYAATETGVGTWETTHLASVGYQASVAAQITAAFWGGATVGRFVLPFLTARVSPAKVVVVCAASASLVLFTATSPALAPYSYAVAGFALGPVLPTTMAWLAGMAPTSAQAANAAILCASMIGSIGSPPLIGAIAGDTAGSVVPISVGSAAALCAIAILVAGHVTRPKKDPVARSGVQG